MCVVQPAGKSKHPCFNVWHGTNLVRTCTLGVPRSRCLSAPTACPPRSDAPLVVLTSVEDLEVIDLTGKIVLLRGELTREQLAPKNFPWWNPQEHQRIIAALEKAAPLAILAATTRNPETAGAVYPFPLIEDGDFDIPSAYMTAEEGQKLAVYAGRKIDLEIRANRALSEGCNVVARKGARGLLAMHEPLSLRTLTRNGARQARWMTALES